MSDTRRAEQPADLLRKVLIVAVLVGGMVVLHQFGVPDPHVDPRGLLAFGFVVLASYTFGELVGRVGLPHITGYIVAGLMLGPSVASLLPDLWQVPPFDEGVLAPRVARQLRLLDTLAISLIALTAGGELKTSELRSTLRPLLGMIGGMLLLAWPALAAVLFVGFGPLGLVELPGFSAAEPVRLAAICAVAGIVLAATSPAATIAVITSTGARGDVTRMVLAGVVLMDVAIATLFSLSANVVAPILGTGSGDTAATAQLAWHLGGSLVFGTGLGALIALYLRYVGAELVLFIVAATYTAAWAVSQLELEAILVFITAGFTVANFSRQGDALIHAVEQLALPTYVVFFTLAGAGLDLAVLQAMAPIAGAVVVVRAGLFFVGVQVGGLLGGATPEVRRFGWLGFVSQAGVAIGLAMLLGRYYGDPGRVLRTLAISVISINELIGPVLLKVGLSLAGELPGRRAAATGGADRRPIREPTNGGEPWVTVATGSEDADAALRRIVGVLRAFVGAAEARVEALRADGGVFLRELRRDLWRHLQDTRPGDPSAARAAEQAVARAWRDQVVARAERGPHEAWRLDDLIAPIEAAVEALPERVTASWPDDALGARPGDGRRARWARATTRARHRLRRWWARDAPTREVPLRDLGRYQLSGVLVAELERVLAAIALAEAEIADATRRLGGTVLETVEAYAAADASGTGELHRRIDEAFDAAEAQLDARCDEISERLARVAGGAARRLAGDALRVGTPDLPVRMRRFGLVYAARTRGLRRLVEGPGEAWRTVSARLGLLALELDTWALEAVARDVADAHGRTLAARVAAEGTDVAARAHDAIEAAIARLQGALAGAPDGAAAADAVRVESDRAQAACREAHEVTRALATRLSSEQATAPIVEGLMRAGSELAERYAVPVEDGPLPEWEITAPPPTVDVPFRAIATRHVEMTVTRELLAHARGLAEGAQRLATSLEEAERAVGFNGDLAVAELQRLGRVPIDAEVREALHEMLIAPLQRHGQRLGGIRAEAEAWPARAEEGLHRAVTAPIAALRADLTGASGAEARLRVLREVTVGRLVHDASGAAEAVWRAWRRGERWLREGVGLDRLALARHRLGLIDGAPVPDEAFAPIRPQVALPAIYRRLFSPQAIEAGELAFGRPDAVEATADALSSGALRAGVVVGVHGLGEAAAARAVAARYDGDVVWRTCDGPVTPAAIDAWFDTARDGQLTVLDGLHGLFEARPGGEVGLQRLVDRLVAEQGRTAWLLTASGPVWEYAREFAPLAAAFPAVLRLDPLTSGELAAALLGRHALTGYGLVFEAEGDVGWQLRYAVARGSNQDRAREAWFATLHAASGGLLRDALGLWLASIRDVDEAAATVRLGPVPRLPVAAFERLSDDALLTLRQAARQGWTTASLHAAVFRVGEAEARAWLARLEHQGLLARAGDQWRVAPHVAGLLFRTLTARGWATW